MKINAYRTLRNGLAAAAALLLFVQNSLPAYHHHVGRKAKKSHSAPRQKTLNLRPAAKNVASGKRSSSTYGRVKQGFVKVTASGHPIATLSKKDRFAILERDGDSFNVRLSDGRTGSIPASVVSMEETRKPVPISDTWSVKGDLVRMAYAYRGARYRSGGTSRRGFDCSGFVKFLYSHEGVQLPHSSRAQFGCGTPVSRAELKPGDIVFFSGTYRSGISHVGIYTGKGKFIHASTQRGGVREDSLDAPYYRGRYSGARRP
ncbi:MAG TPA: C40 family peptidase [Armatimonadota bacterium]